MSVKTLASWTAHDLSTRPGNPSGPAALRMLTRLKVLFTSATECYPIVIQNNWCSCACFSVAYLEASIKYIQLVWQAHVTGQLASGFPFVVHNSLQALPHQTSVRAGVVGFNLSPVLTLACFMEGIAGLLISGWVRVLLLESGSSTLQLSAHVACNPWLLVGVCAYGHCGDDIIDAVIDEASD